MCVKSAVLKTVCTANLMRTSVKSAHPLNTSTKTPAWTVDFTVLIAPERNVYSVLLDIDLTKLVSNAQTRIVKPATTTPVKFV